MSGSSPSGAAPFWRRLARRLGAARGVAGGPARLEFDRATLPWLDRRYAEVDAYVGGLPAGELPAYDLRGALVQWARDGYVSLPGLVEPGLIDAYLADLDELVRTRARRRALVIGEGLGARPIGELPDSPGASGESCAT